MSSSVVTATFASRLKSGVTDHSRKTGVPATELREPQAFPSLLAILLTFASVEAFTILLSLSANLSQFQAPFCDRATSIMKEQ
jgi:hypothetical protein